MLIMLSRIISSSDRWERYCLESLVLYRKHMAKRSSIGTEAWVQCPNSDRSRGLSQGHFVRKSRERSDSS
jgi:hypothetical protein